MLKFSLLSFSGPAEERRFSDRSELRRRLGFQARVGRCCGPRKNSGGGLSLKIECSYGWFLGERTIKGCLEAYSCKHAMWELIKDLSYENEMLAKSSHTDSSSPVDLLLSRSRNGLPEGNEDSSLLEAIYEPLMRLQN